MADPGVVRTVSLRLSQSFSKKNLRCALFFEKKSEIWAVGQIRVHEFLVVLMNILSSMKFKSKKNAK